MRINKKTSGIKGYYYVCPRNALLRIHNGFYNFNREQRCENQSLVCGNSAGYDSSVFCSISYKCKKIYSQIGNCETSLKS